MGGDPVKENGMESVRSVVFKQSETLEGSCIKIEGYDFNRGIDYPELLHSMISTGFQASNLGDAIQVVNQMVDVHYKILPYNYLYYLIWYLFVF